MERAPMSEPERWLDSEQASAEVLELLRVAKPPAAIDRAARARSLRRVSALALTPAIAAAKAVSWTQIALGGALGMLGTLATMSAAQHLFVAEQPALVAASSSARPKPVDREAAPPASSPPLPPSAAALTSAFALPSRSQPLAAPAQPSSPENQLDQEIALLEMARARLGASPPAALSALRDHELRFPAGQLRIEREFLIVDALVRLGRRTEAEARARALEQQAPKSLYGERLDRILGTRN
jgi:hypothetical protein